MMETYRRKAVALPQGALLGIAEFCELDISSPLTMTAKRNNLK